MKNYERVYQLVKKFNNIEEITIEDILYISKIWKSIFIKFLIDWGFNKEATEQLFKFGDGGYNWIRLHPNRIENNQSLYKRLESFIGEINYCADRMYLDRLLRCQYEFNHMINRFNEDTYSKYSYRGLELNLDESYPSVKYHDKYHLNESEFIICHNCIKNNYKGKNACLDKDLLNIFNVPCQVCGNHGVYYITINYRLLKPTRIKKSNTNWNREKYIMTHDQMCFCELYEEF